MAFLFLLILGGTVAYAVGVARYWSLQVVSMEPNPIVAGPGRHLIFKGTGFDPSTTIRLGDYPPRAGGWDESTLGIEINEKIDPGIYPVSVRDGRGRSVVLPDPLEVVWMPQVSEIRPKYIYPTGEGSRLDILGEFFTRSRSVRIGDREMDTRNSVDPNHIVAPLKKGDPPLPLGEYPVTVTNAGGQSVTWERGVTVVPVPEVHSVTPNRTVLGDTVDLSLYGRNLRKGTLVWFDEKHRVGEATWISPECLKVRVKTDYTMAGRASDVILDLPNGPKIKVLEDAVYINNAYEVFMVVAVLLDDQSTRAIREFEGSLEWKLKRPLGDPRFPGPRRNFNVRPLPNPNPVIEVLLPAVTRMVDGKFETLDVRWRALSKGKGVWFTLYGQELAGIVVEEPYAVFSDDYFSDKRKM